MELHRSLAGMCRILLRGCLLASSGCVIELQLSKWSSIGVVGSINSHSWNQCMFGLVQWLCHIKWCAVNGTSTA